MKKALNIAKWVGAVGAFIFLAAFENAKEATTRVQQTVHVELIQHQNQLFLNREEIHQLITNQYDSISKLKLKAINTALLEESLENHPFIADAEVFSTLDGQISVQVEQKLAIARVINKKQPYYLDANGHPFPVTKAYSAAVPVFTGATDSTNLHRAFSLMSTIKNIPFYTNWLAEIHTNKDGNFEIIPLVGRHKIIFGDAKNANQKLEKLKGFYHTVVTEENLNDWKTLNVAYNNQLISTKY